MRLCWQGADVNTESDEGTTGLLLAAQYGRIGVAEVLTANGIQVFIIIIIQALKETFWLGKLLRFVSRQNVG